MKIVLDTNILFSALIKNSITRKLILEYEGLFLFPEYIFTEFEKHKVLLLKKTAMPQDDFETLMTHILKKVVIVPHEAVALYKEKAVEIVKDIDINDVLFVACFLAHPNSILWSDDRALKKISQIRVLNTAEIIEFLKI